MMVKTARCRDCGAPILWLRYQKTGKIAAIDAQKSEYGHVFIDTEAGTYGINPHHLWLEFGRPWGYANHMETCTRQRIEHLPGRE